MSELYYHGATSHCKSPETKTKPRNETGHKTKPRNETGHKTKPRNETGHHKTKRHEKETGHKTKPRKETGHKAKKWAIRQNHAMKRAIRQNHAMKRATIRQNDTKKKRGPKTKIFKKTFFTYFSLAGSFQLGMRGMESLSRATLLIPLST